MKIAASLRPLCQSVFTFVEKTSAVLLTDQRWKSFLFLNRQSEVKRATQGLGKKKTMEIYGGRNKNKRILQLIQSMVVADLRQVLQAPRSVLRL